jgi:hypothetical protein
VSRETDGHAKILKYTLPLEILYRPAPRSVSEVRVAAYMPEPTERAKDMLTT